MRREMAVARSNPGFTYRTWERYHAPMAVPEARGSMGGPAHARARARIGQIGGSSRRSFVRRVR
jgi:hypothetical protein